MTLWQVLLVVAVAWFSGALFGVGLKDLLVGLKPVAPKAPKWNALAQALKREAKAQPDEAGAGAGACETAAAPEIAIGPVLRDVPPMAPADESGAPPRRRFFWIEEGETNDEAGRDVAPALVEASPSEPALVDLPASSVEALTKPVAAPATGVRPIAEAAGSKTVSSVKVYDFPQTLAPAVKTKRKNGRYRSDPNESAWRALDRRARSEGVMFWFEIAMLLVLLAGASWGVVYFATQPVMGVLR